MFRCRNVFQIHQYLHNKSKYKYKQNKQLEYHNINKIATTINQHQQKLFIITSVGKYQDSRAYSIVGDSTPSSHLGLSILSELI